MRESADELADRGTDRLWHAQRTGDAAALDEAVELFRRAVAVRRPAALSIAVRRSYLAAALLTRFEQAATGDDLGAAMRLARRSVRDVADDDPEAAVVHANYGAAVATAYAATGESRRLTAAMAALRTAVRLARPDDTRTASYLGNLAALLELAYERRGRRADLDEAVTAGRAATDAPGSEPVEHRSTLANTLLVRCHMYGDPTDLTAALHEYDLIEAALTDGHPLASAVCGRAGDAWCLAYLDGRGVEALDEAVRLHRRAVGAAGPGDRTAAGKLATSLRMRYEATGRGADLDEMVDLARAPVGRPGLPGEAAARQSTLATVLHTRFEHAGDPADLEAAVVAARTAVEVSPRRAPQRRLRLANLAEILRTRVLAEGRFADLEEAVQAADRSIAGLRRSDPARPHLAGLLANVLTARYRRLGQRSDLDRAIRLATDAVSASHDASHHDSHDASDDASHDASDDASHHASHHASHGADPLLAARLSNLAELLRIRYDDRADEADADAAIATAQQAAAWPGGSALPALWSTLGNALMVRYTRRGDPADATAAARAHRRALAAASPDAVAWPRLVGNLGALYARRWEITHQARHLDRAVELFAEAAEAAPPRSADRAAQRINQALFLVARYSRARRPEDATAARAAAAEASAIGSAPAAHRVNASVVDGDIQALTGAWADAASAYRRAVEHLPEAAWPGIDLDSQLAQLGRWTALPGTAVGAALQAGDPAGAVTVVEQGRAVRWSRLLDRRADHRRLTAEHGEPAHRLDELRAALDA